MKVELVGHTFNPVVAMGTAAIITRGKTIEEVMDSEHPFRECMNVLKTCYEQGHWAVFEFADFDFEVQGVSRVLEAQVNRNRISSYMWETGRRDQEYESADWVKTHPGFRDFIGACTEDAISSYNAAVEQKYEAEEARYILPQGVARKGRIKKNFRNLLETAQQRLCVRAQGEYWCLVNLMKRQIVKIEPFLGNLLQPKCIYQGYCNESKENSCGLRPHKTEIERLVLDAGL